MAANGQRHARLDASICEARAKACVSIYSRIFVTLRSRMVMSKTQSSLNDLFVALIFPVATPTTITRSPCATNSGGFGYVVSTSSDAFLSTAANSACPRYVPASGQASPGMIHSISSPTNADRFLLLLEHILEYEATPSLAACVHQRATLVELSQLDGCEPEFFGQIRHGSDGVLVAARQKDDPMATLDNRIGRQSSRNQMVEPLHDLGAGERLRHEG